MLNLNPIGRIKTPFQRIEDCPNNVEAEGPDCEIILDAEFAPGLNGLREGQSVLLLYWFENVDRTLVTQTRGPRADGEMVGTFALRSPHRPNPIAVSTVPILWIENGKFGVQGLDCISGTKLLDIKPATR
ncbi:MULTISPECIES: SAM-dependent methyltransferase [unclassified Leisingera]|uniref:SAM-dependent methyltransferase n=1 Tax=unclassified Leisingera TaxID=2614906 RepID=UPI0009E245B1|nr:MULTISPECIES: SAM-dependent methyltransferase [unclassified Leisingera]